MLLFCSVSADVQCRVEDETKPSLIGNAKNRFPVKWLSEIFLLRNANKWQEDGRSVDTSSSTESCCDKDLINEMFQMTISHGFQITWTKYSEVSRESQ